MAKQPPLNHITINDWTPGIADRVGFKWPPGQAQRTNTFRCRASKSGALIPGPKQDYARNGTDFEGVNPSASGKYFCSGIFTPGPVVPVAGNADAQGRAHELWIATEYALLTPTKSRRLERVRQFEAAPTTDLIYTADNASASDAALAWGVTWGQTRANTAASTTPGVPVLAIAWGSSIAGVSVCYEYPNNTTPGLNAPFLVTTAICLVTTHQGRFVLRIQTGYLRGVNGSWSTTEDLRWTPVNNPHGALSILQAFYPENTDGYSVMASMSANELFMLKESGGIVATGDLDSPFITNLPMVPGSGGVASAAQGVRGPIGFLYGTQTGIWVWSHGDSAQLLSPMLLPGFWQTGVDEVYLGNAYQWCSEANFIFLSNNFYYDTDTNAFWRLEDPSVMLFRWMSCFRQFVYGARSSYTHADLTLIRGYNLTTKSTSYSFQSFPLIESLDTLIEVREVTLRVLGTGTVTITLTNQNGNTFAKTFTFSDNNFPHLQQSNVGRGASGSFQGDNITYRIESTGTGGNEAPTVQFLDFGWQPAQRVTTQ